MRGRPGPALDPLRTLFEAGTVAGLTDGQLLERFASRRDDVAEMSFAALVARHGSMVRRVCRLMLEDPNDAEDAFQATFLVLARKAGAIRRPERLGNWLYGTAHRASRTLRTRAARRRKHEAREATLAGERLFDEPEPLVARREEIAVVHEEVDRLPGPCREAVVLCDLEGRAHEEVARLLGCSDRTLRRRLFHARDLLRVRLTRRGVAPTAGLIAAALAAEPAAAAIPQMTVDAMARAAHRFAAGQAAAGTVPASASTLAEGVITAMLWTRSKGIAIAAAVVLATGIGAGVTLGFVAPDDGKKVGTNEAPKAKEPTADANAKSNVWGERPAEPAQVPPLSVRIVPTSYREDGGGTIRLHQPSSHFYVVITNASGQPIRLWKEWCSWGYSNLSFEVRDGQGRSVAVEKAGRAWGRNFPDWEVIPPGGHLVREIDFDPTTWANWPMPEAGGSRPVRLRAIYSIPAEPLTKEHRIWTGRVSSPEESYELRK